MDNAALSKLYQNAIAFMRQRKYEDALTLLKAVLQNRDSWEHGNANYFAAISAEELGRLHEAELNYRAALKLDNSNNMFVGGLAAFLYLHGAADEALQLYTVLKHHAELQGDKPRIDQLMLAINTLNHKVNLKESNVE